MKSGLYISAAALTREIEEDGWLLALPAVAGLRERPLVFHRPVTFFVGENGTGKSTLLEAIAAAWALTRRGAPGTSPSPPGPPTPPSGGA